VSVWKPWSNAGSVKLPSVVGVGIRRVEAVMGRHDPARGVTDGRYASAAACGVGARSCDGAGLPSGVVPEAVGQS